MRRRLVPAAKAGKGKAERPEPLEGVPARKDRKGKAERPEPLERRVGGKGCPADGLHLDRRLRGVGSWQRRRGALRGLRRRQL